MLPVHLFERKRDIFLSGHESEPTVIELASEGLFIDCSRS